MGRARLMTGLIELAIKDAFPVGSLSHYCYGLKGKGWLQLRSSSLPYFALYYIY